MQTEKLIDLLAKCLELASSDMDGEALAAARKANDLRQKLGMTWAEALSGRPTAAAQAAPADPPPMQARLSEEIARLQFRISELQLEAERNKRRMESAELEANALREALDEGSAVMERRERELRQRLTELEGMLNVERERNQQATARLAALQDIQEVADKRVRLARKAARTAEERCQAIEETLRSSVEREITLRQELDDTRREIESRDGEFERLTARVAELEMVGGGTDTLPPRIAPSTGKQMSAANPRQPEPRRGIPALRLIAERYGDGGSPRDGESFGGGLLGGGSNTGLTVPDDDGDDVTGSEVFTFGSGRNLVVEVKPLSRMFIYANLRRAEAAMSYARGTGADYVVASASGVTLGTLLNFELDPMAVADVLAEIDRLGTLSWSAYQELRERHDLKMIHTGALVVQHNLFYSRLPWRLKRLPDGESFAALKHEVAAIGH